jgi:signal transduction histidine kinase
MMRSSLEGTYDKMSEFLASLPCVVYESASDFTIRAISPNVFDLIGIQPESLKDNRSLWEDRLNQEDRQRLFARLEQLRGAEIASEDHRLLDDQGLPVWVSHSFRKVERNHDIRIHGSITPLLRDVRGRSLDSAIISQFIHKIGNHFQLINLLIGSLKRNGTSSDEIQSLQDTVDRAVEFTRSFSQYIQTPVYVSAVELGEILRSVIEFARPLFSEKEVAFNAHVDESLNGAQISGDPFLLELALGSLIQNALDATRSADQVIIDARKETFNSTSRSIARVGIVDTGIGMEKETLARASTPFFSSKRERSGLGLSMAIRILEMHGGLLNISSDQGCGTRVEIALPVSESVE